MSPGFEYDFAYCKHNGFLAEDLVANLHNYTYLYDRAAQICAARDVEFNASAFSAAHLLALYDPTIDSQLREPPGPAHARALGAWACAMGGPGADMAYCAYTYRDLGDGKFCQYPAGPGWKGTSFEGTAEAAEWKCNRSSSDAGPTVDVQPFHLRGDAGGTGR